MNEVEALRQEAEQLKEVIRVRQLHPFLNCPCLVSDIIWLLIMMTRQCMYEVNRVGRVS